MTSQERSLERQMACLGYLIKAGAPLRLENFEPMLKGLRKAGDSALFPLNRTTVKSSLKALVNEGLVNAEPMRVYKHRNIIFYLPTESGRAAWQAWNGAS